MLDHYGTALVRRGELAAAATQLAEAERRSRHVGDWPTLFGTLDDEADCVRDKDGTTTQSVSIRKSSL